MAIDIPSFLTGVAEYDTKPFLVTVADQATYNTGRSAGDPQPPLNYFQIAFRIPYARLVYRYMEELLFWFTRNGGPGLTVFQAIAGDELTYSKKAFGFDLMTDGMSVTDAARRELAGGDEGRPLTLADYASTSGISLELEGEIWVNAPIRDFNPNFVDAPAHVLAFDGDRFLVRSGDLEATAEPVPVPDYHDHANRWGDPYTSFAITHTDRVRISPIEGCGIVCKFCDLPYEFRYRKKPIEGLVDSIHRALHDRRLPARHVLISGGTPRPEDFDYEQQVYEAVAAAFPELDVDIMMVPSPGLLDLRHLAAIGIHGLSINLEIYNQRRADEVMPLKARLTRGYYLDFIEQATGEQDKASAVISSGTTTMRDVSRQVKGTTEEQARGAARIQESIEGVRQVVEQIDGALQEQTAACTAVLRELSRVQSTTETQESATRTLDAVTRALREHASALRQEVASLQI